jgi:hypothetical protein
MPGISRFAKIALFGLASGVCSEAPAVNLPLSPVPDHGLKTRRQTDKCPPTSKILNITSSLKRTTCELHGLDLALDVVPIEGGYVDQDEEYVTAHKTLFPNAASVIGGGCLPMEETHARVKYCPACRAAKEGWMANHPGIRELGDRDPR